MASGFQPADQTEIDSYRRRIVTVNDCSLNVKFRGRGFLQCHCCRRWSCCIFIDLVLEGECGIKRGDFEAEVGGVGEALAEGVDGFDSAFADEEEGSPVGGVGIGRR